MKKRFNVKHLKDGRSMLNLACGGRMYAGWNNIDFSPLVRLARHAVLARGLRKAGILSEKRYERIIKTDTDIIYWDLRKGIPFADGSYDVVYHSHFLEHLDVDAARALMAECHRVLKPAGCIRVVVPDLEIRCRKYLDSLYEVARAEKSDFDGAMVDHQENIRWLLGQMVASELAGTAEQPSFVRVIERFFRGDTVRAGEAHRWMYDKYTLESLLTSVCFREVSAVSPFAGRIEGWLGFFLDTNEDGGIYKRDSIYLEGIK